MQMLSAAKLLAVSLLVVVPLTAGQANGPGFKNGNPVSSKLSQTSPTDPWGQIALMVRSTLQHSSPYLLVAAVLPSRSSPRPSLSL